MSSYEVAKSILAKDLSGIKYSYKMLQTPDEVLAQRKGDCFEQVELARSLLEKQGIACKSYFMEMNRGDEDAESWKHFIVHGFIVFEEGDNVYWFERAYCSGKFIGVHQYDSLKSLLSDFRQKTIDCFKNHYKIPTNDLKIRQYDAPKFPVSYTDHILNCLNKEEINIDDL
jgi:hypothetical protein